MTDNIKSTSFKKQNKYSNRWTLFNNRILTSLYTSNSENKN